jgi:hypothetical protein
MRIFELRACWKETYDCPDNGEVNICDTYEAIALAIDDDTQLKAIAAELAKGFNGEYWSKRRADALQKLYPGYDDFRDTQYKIVEMTDLIVSEKHSS